MASSINTDRIEDVANALSLGMYFPEKLSRNVLYEITNLSLKDSDDITQDNIAKHFINRITRLNYHARGLEKKFPEETKKANTILERRNQQKQAQSKCVINFHPLDILVAVFLCCDPIAKQDLVKFLWDCKLAVPFILRKDGCEDLTLFKWPLRQLITTCHDTHENTSKKICLYKQYMQNIGIVRIGRCDDSKSALINGIIGGSEKTHPMFFHRDLKASRAKRSDAVDGLIEIGWYLPKGSESDTFKQCISFANLRGDATKNKKQTHALCTLMNVIVILTHTRHLEDGNDTLRSIVANSKKVLIVLTDKEIGELEDEVIDTVFDDLDIPLEQIIVLESNSFPEKLAIIVDCIAKMLTVNHSVKTDTPKSINDFCLDTVNVSFDENSRDMEAGILAAEKILQYVYDVNQTDERKRIIFPLQGKPWKNWTESELEIHRLDKFNKMDQENDVLSYRDSLENKKKSSRQEQMNLITNEMSDAMKLFISYTSDLSGTELQIFLRALKLGIDDNSREALGPYYVSYQNILTKKNNASADEIDKYNKELEELDQHKNELFSFGMEHFVRELGQIFEACMSQEGADCEIKLSGTKGVKCSDLPRIGSKLLLNGYPIEIMDGDASFVPEVWVKEVINETRQELKGKQTEQVEVLVHVIAVLGIQSSGKSTLLNTMFGTQFAVSAGRCTKGVFMQLVQISKELRKPLGCNYVIVLDTEGLRSQHLSDEKSIKIDNLLSCFGIGMADITIVNLMGESQKYLEENLPVVVRAFLRMELVGLKPRCIIVHQNVDKIEKNKLMEQNQLLEKVLDELTEKNCIREKKKIMKFNKIIEFNLDRDTDYITSLYEGQLPMAPISPGYSQGCNELRKKMLKQITMSSRRMNFMEYATLLGNLWNAIKKNQFVFEFKSTLEQEARLNLDAYYYRVYCSIWERVSTIGDNACKTISKCKNESELTQIYEDLKKTNDLLLNTVETQENLQLFTYIQTSITTVLPWKEKFLQRFDDDFKEAKVDCLYQIEDMVQKKLSGKLFEEIINSEDIAYLKRIIYNSPQGTVRDIWEEWIKHISNRIIKTRKESYTCNIKGDVSNYLHVLFESNTQLLADAMSKKPLEKYSFSDFIVNKSHVMFYDESTYDIRKKELQDIALTVKKMVDDTITNLVENERQYTSIKVKQIMYSMHNITNANTNKFTNAYLVELTLAISGYVIKKLSKYYKNEESIKNLLFEKRKPQYFRMIEALVKERTVEMEVIKDIVDSMFRGIVPIVQKTLCSGSTVVAKFRGVNKVRLINMCLDYAVSQKSRTILELYRKDPEKAVQYYIKTHITHEHLIQEAKPIISAKINTIRATIEKCGKALTDSCDILTWVKRIFQSEQFHFEPEDFQEIKLINADVKQLELCILKHLDNSCDADLDRLTRDVVENSKPSLAEQISIHFTEMSFGCKAKCPFCKEVCMYSSKNHPEKHETKLHRPLGTQGIHDVKTKCVSLQTCESYVASNASFASTNQHSVRFKDYQTYYCDWYIHADPSLEVSAFWKWYFVNYKEDVLKDGTLKLKIPPSWESLRIWTVLKQLNSE